MVRRKLVGIVVGMVYGGFEEVCMWFSGGKEELDHQHSKWEKSSRILTRCRRKACRRSWASSSSRWSSCYLRRLVEIGTADCARAV